MALYVACMPALMQEERGKPTPTIFHPKVSVLWYLYFLAQIFIRGLWVFNTQCVNLGPLLTFLTTNTRTRTGQSVTRNAGTTAHCRLQGKQSHSSLWASLDQPYSSHHLSRGITNHCLWFGQTLQYMTDFVPRHMEVPTYRTCKYESSSSKCVYLRNSIWIYILFHIAI